ncbi:B-cell lymphoma 3 protein [Cololabis saira]|uniref:B-cell lymphoma 3 protein n=1 Tax=Cololabis saira TaxID=129043 RepID=UPI002AD1DF21|nr:B-cell lymphoma 3 protein [Cololabis saira]
MPRVMTMNSDHHGSVASAPLDLSTSARSGPPELSICAGDAQVMRGSPAPPAGTGTRAAGAPWHSLTASPDTDITARSRPADRSSLKLPFRKRKIPYEPESQTPAPALPVSAKRASPVQDATSALRESPDGRSPPAEDDSLSAPPPVTPWRLPDTGESLESYYSFCLAHPRNYVQQVYCLPLVPTKDFALGYPPENFLPGISLATHQDEDGDTALHIAVVQGKLSMVHDLIRLLLRARRPLDIYNNLRQTPLHLAVITKQANIVDILLRAGADPAALDRHGQTAFHLCCEYDHSECLSVLLSLCPSSTCLEIRNFEGLSPLHLAVMQGHEDLAKMLLDAGADINAMDIKSGLSPLMHAVESNNADMVRFLIESQNACDVNGQTYSGNTALHIACGRGQVDIVRLLLKSGADSSLKNYHNDTPVMVAKNKKIADVLRGRASKIRAQDQHSVSVLLHGSTFMENGSSSPNHSLGSSPSTTPNTPHHNTSLSPNTPSAPFRY